MNYSLTITQLKTAKASADGKPFKLRDGGGLFVFVSATGAKSWRYKYRISGKESVYTMGTFPDLGIADARVMHAKARELVNQGVHPKAQRDADRHITMLIAGDTFKAVADHWFEERKPKWTAYYASPNRNINESGRVPSHRWTTDSKGDFCANTSNLEGCRQARSTSSRDEYSPMVQPSLQIRDRESQS
jgi:hypothetical protein